MLLISSSSRHVIRQWKYGVIRDKQVWRCFLVHFGRPIKILHNHCFQFLPGITGVPRKIEDNAELCKKSKKSKLVHYGLGENGEI